MWLLSNFLPSSLSLSRTLSIYPSNLSCVCVCVWHGWPHFPKLLKFYSFTPTDHLLITCYHLYISCYFMFPSILQLFPSTFNPSHYHSSTSFLITDKSTFLIRLTSQIRLDSFRVSLLNAIFLCLFRFIFYFSVKRFYTWNYYLTTNCKGVRNKFFLKTFLSRRCVCVCF